MNVSGQAVSGDDFGGYGTAEVLPVDQLNIDPDYQRDVRHDLVNKIGREYDLVKAGPILVNERSDKTLWVVDGQHRLLGAIQFGEQEVFANVTHGLTQEQEAALRLARNDRRSDSIYEKFRTRLVMNDRKAHAIREVVVQQGGRINLSPNASQGINAVATLEVLYDIDGRGVWLGRTLRVIREAFQREDQTPEQALSGDIVGASMLKSVAWFLGQHVDSGEVPEHSFVERLGTGGADDVRRKAVSHKAANGGAIWINYYRALVELWNYRRQEANMIRWKTIGGIATLGEHSRASASFTGRSGEPGRMGR